MSKDNNGCVLIVEDEVDMLNITALLLESCGYKVGTARNGAEALALLQRIRPCLILLDLMMPVMDGWQFLAAQARDPSLASLPVVVMTGAGIAAEQNTLFARVGAILKKPVDTNLLLRIIARYCAADHSPASGC